MGTRWWIPPIWLLTCAIVQGSLIPALGVRQGRPDFVLQSVVIWAVTNGAREALGWALVGGVCLDAVSGAPPGTATLALVLVAFLSSAGDVSQLGNVPWLPMATVFLATVVHGAILMVILASQGMPNGEWIGTMQWVVVPEAVANVLTMPLTYWALRRIASIDRPRIRLQFGRQ